METSSRIERICDQKKLMNSHTCIIPLRLERQMITAAMHQKLQSNSSKQARLQLPAAPVNMRDVFVKAIGHVSGESS